MQERNARLGSFGSAVWLSAREGNTMERSSGAATVILAASRLDEAITMPPR